MKKNDITCSTCSTFLKRWIKSNERMSKACTNSRLRNGGGEGGRERKKIGERIRIRKRTMKESKRTKQRANVLRCMNRKEKVEKTARTK